MTSKYIKVFWHDHKPSDDNNGLIYGIERIDIETDLNDDYIEWFKTKEERDKMFNSLTKEGGDN